MTVRKLLAELEAAGIQVTREGDVLRVRGEPGVTLAPYIDRIRELKPEILTYLTLPLQARIIAVATVEPGQFDRAVFDALMATWERGGLLTARLEEGWRRIEAAEAAGRDVAEWEDFWLSLLADYERACQGITSEATMGDKP